MKKKPNGPAGRLLILIGKQAGKFICIGIIMRDMGLDEAIRCAADAIGKAGALLITSGAGMGVDSGLPDFRGEKGFWKAYPMYERLGVTFVGAANPEHFIRDPEFGWGFYGHRANLYRSTEPHEGFRILRRWIERFRLEHFIVTSNVDGQFQKAGFREGNVLEVHGSIHYLQCLQSCTGEIWPFVDEIPVDIETMRAMRIPRCVRCDGVARPNVLMFGDFSWLSHRTDRQESEFESFLDEITGRRTVVVEMGAGTAIPTIRNLSERVGQRAGVTVVRINPREPWIDAPHLSIPAGSLVALKAIDGLIR